MLGVGIHQHTRFFEIFWGKMDLLLCKGKGSIFTSRFTFSFLRYAVGFLDRA